MLSDGLVTLSVLMFCALVYLLVSGTLLNGVYSNSVIKKCEEELPRSQSCRIIAEPIPKEAVNE